MLHLPWSREEWAGCLVDAYACRTEKENISFDSNSREILLKKCSENRIKRKHLCGMSRVVVKLIIQVSIVQVFWDSFAFKISCLKTLMFVLLVALL